MFGNIESLDVAFLASLSLSLHRDDFSTPSDASGDVLLRSLSEHVERSPSSGPPTQLDARGTHWEPGFISFFLF